MKGFTDIEQSKKLSEILQIESADMYYHYNRSVVNDYYEDVPKWTQLNNHFVFFNNDIPCWSLTALLGVLPDTMLGKDKDGYVVMVETMGSGQTTFASNPIDACVDMIEKLHELNIL